MIVSGALQDRAQYKSEGQAGSSVSTLFGELISTGLVPGQRIRSANLLMTPKVRGLIDNANLWPL
jgi:hypothetical protein